VGGPRLITALTVLAAVAACGGAPDPPSAPASPSATTTNSTTNGTTSGTAPSPPAGTTTSDRPGWRVGARPLPRRPDGFGQVLPTPPQLASRDLPTVDRLPPPPGGRFTATVAPVPAAVLARSTMRPDCPVRAGDLRYLTVSFWGFDDRAHTGEMIVARSVADAVTRAFASLFRARFPIEEMRVVTAAELAGPPTGDGNNTTAFVCRPAVGQRRWSAHALGLAIDVNPFCNPYVRGDLVLPELASSYLDRGNDRPGMVQPGGPAVRAFTAIGWLWGGEWPTPVDLQHFSATGD
jgi:hypothetical protein